MADPKTSSVVSLFDSHSAQPYLVFSLDNALFGADIRSIQRVSRVGRIAQLPSQPDYVKGLTIISGRSLKVIDLRLRFGLPEVAYHEHTYALELNGGSPCAVVVDSVKQVERFAERDILGLDAGNRHHPRPVIGIVRRDGLFCMLLDLHCILAQDFVSRVDTSGYGQESARGSQARSALAKRRPPTQASVNGMIGRLSSISSPEFPPLSTIASSSHELDGLVNDSEPLRLRENEPSEVNSPPESAVLVERALKSLAMPMRIGTRRIPRFRSGDPRLVAVASGLLQMPPTFKTAELAPVVAGLLDQAIKGYGVRRVRYDLAKLRARELAERIGSSRSYRLTKLGEITCRTIVGGDLRRNSQKIQVA